MPTIPADILRIPGARGHIADEMTSGDADQGMPDHIGGSIIFQKRMPTVARMLDKAVSTRDTAHAMAE